MLVHNSIAHKTIPYTKTVCQLILKAILLQDNLAGLLHCLGG